MSARLQKLWAERGDFSRFRASELASKRGRSETDGHEEHDAAPSEDLGANLEGLMQEEGESGVKDEQQEGKEVGEKADVKRGDIMSIEDMRRLRTQMLEKLGVAQNSLYFSHALVSLLVNTTKPGAEAPSSALHSATRAGSTASGAAATAQARAGATSASGMQRSAMGATQGTMGSSSTLEAELGIEAHVFGASRIEAQRRDMERPGGEEEEDEEEEEADEDEEDAEKEAQRIAKQDAKLLDDEVDDHAKDLVERYEGKLQGVRAAVSILRKGATTIHPDNEGAGRDKVRWQALMHAKRAGWSLTPDKPIRGTAAKKRELLDDFSKRKDEPARDAWIGFAVPESSSFYRRMALAYLSHSSTEGDRPVDALLFASRPEKKLQVQVVVGEECWTSKDEDVRDHETLASTPNTLDGMLRIAQSELVDAELFDTLVAECRALSTSGTTEVTIENEGSVAIQINPTTKIRFIQVSARIDDDDDGKQGGTTNTCSTVQHESPLVTCLLAMLRLGLLCRYRDRAGLQSREDEEGQATNRGNEEEVKAPLLQPLLGLLHYASFVARLHIIMATLAIESDDVRFELDAFDRIGDGREWLQLLLQQPGKTGSMTAVKRLGGSATVLFKDR